MGCWNETCGISRLPIEHNDKCVMLLIKMDVVIPNELDNNKTPMSINLSLPSYIDDYFLRKILYFEKGEYDDYGYIKGFEDKFKNFREEIHSKVCSGMILKLIFLEKYWDIVLNFNNNEECSFNKYMDDLFNADDNLVKLGFSSISNFKINRNGIKYIYKVLSLLLQNRINPDNSLFQGSQSRNYELQKLILPELTKDVEFGYLLNKLWENGVDDPEDILNDYYEWDRQTQFLSYFDSKNETYKKIKSSYTPEYITSSAIVMLENDMFGWNLISIILELNPSIEILEEERGKFDCLKNKLIKWYRDKEKEENKQCQ